MTYEEALMLHKEIAEQFEKNRQTLKLAHRAVFDLPLDEAVGANALAIEAIEKQIPKQPKIDRITFMNGSVYFDELCCPTCNNYLIQRDDHGKYFAGSKCAYCEDCGQKISWSEK